MVADARSISVPAAFRLHHVPVLDSTNAEALRWLSDGTARHFDAILADTQTAGRGRRGRRWQSLKGNLHLTVVVLPPSGAAVGQIAFVAAVTIGKAIGSLVSDAADLRYKWPNDVLIGGAKLAGILIEAEGHGLAVGIGVNVAVTPLETAFPATSLDAAGACMSVTDLVAPICERFAAWYDRWCREGFAPVRTAWLAGAYGLGRLVEARMPDGSTRRGVFCDLDGDGALLIEEPGGERIAVTAADVHFQAV